MLHRICLLIGLSIFCCSISSAQAQRAHPYSTEADIGHPACRDTIRFLSFKRGYEIGGILPSWQAVMNEDYVAVCEGKVIYNRTDGTDGTHVSHEDLPFFHYTRDLCVDIVPDSTSDGRYTDLLPYLISTRSDGTKDTSLQGAMGIEWEAGLGAGNRINPCAKLNNEGKSCGFYSEGHERGDIIWNWPATGDWIHVEGKYIWDRGHPPANCEIHPARLMAVKRELPAKIKVSDGFERFATRVDIFASGDGGGVDNNRADAKPFVMPVKMSSKDYQFTFKVNFARPSANAVLKVRTDKRNGDSYPADEILTANADGSVSVSIPWKSRIISDRAVYARTVYAWWDEGNGVAATDTIDEFQVDLKKLYLKKLSEMDGMAEIRLFVNVGDDWIFLNDFFGKGGKVLTRGMGETAKKHWDLSNSFTLYVPRGKKFRVYMAGWEADGVDYLMGDIMDPASPCDTKTKHYFKRKFFSISNMFFRGCEDDKFGEISNLYGYSSTLAEGGFCTLAPQNGKSEDPCPNSKYSLKDRYFFSYCITKK